MDHFVVNLDQPVVDLEKSQKLLFGVRLVYAEYEVVICLLGDVRTHWPAVQEKDSLEFDKKTCVDFLSSKWLSAGRWFKEFVEESVSNLIVSIGWLFL